MGAETGIEWTDATWNPTRGCTRVSEGCRNCYAEIMAARFNKPGQWGHGFAGTWLTGKAGASTIDHRWTGKVELIESQLDLPLKWKTPRKIFVNSTSDLFHESLPDEAIDDVFAVAAVAQQHILQILTKRHKRMHAYMTNVEREAYWMNAVARLMERLDLPDARVPILTRREPWLPLPNVWLGVSAEDQPRWDERVADLGATPAAVRFVSVEPMLAFIDCGNAFDPPPDDSPYRPIDWVICGGESGRDARPMHPEWARSLRDQCAAAGVPFFFKQWGEWGLDEGRQPDGSDPIMDGRARCAWFDGTQWHFEDSGYDVSLEASKGCGQWLYRLGKKRNARLLDGVEHNEFPRMAA